MKCTDLLLQDHQYLRRALQLLDGMVAALESGGRIEIADATAVLGFLRRFGNDNHEVLEERILFPTLLMTTPDRFCGGILAAHTSSRELLAEMEEHLKWKRARQFVDGSRGLAELLERHLSDEDGLLQEAARSILSTETDEQMGAELAAHRTAPELYLNFARLEGKYASAPVEGRVKAVRAQSQAHRAAAAAAVRP